MEAVKGVVKSIVENGVLGPVKFVSVSFHDEGKNDTHFASSIVFLDITVNNGSSNEIFKGVLKLPVTSSAVQELLGCKDLFVNEVIMYKELLPLIDAQEVDIFPRLFYGNVKEGKDVSEDLIILEDLSPKGFVLPHDRVFLPFNHMSLILDKLGQFHALSHKAKAKNPQTFMQWCRQLTKSKFETDEGPDLQYICAGAMQRGITHLLEKVDGEKKNILKKFSKKTDSVKTMVETIFSPEEPYAVLCHGDFNRNNIFVKYENQEPVDIKFFDLQTPRYTTPALDLAFILYMNSTKELRDQHWDHLLQIYWKGFTKVLPQPGFGFEDFHRHFAKVAVYGYIPTSFFLPHMMDKNPISIEEMQNYSIEEKVKLTVAKGGEEGTKAISDILDHLLQKGYINAFLSLDSK